MSILYINRDSVCFCNDNLSDIYYYSEKKSIEYDKVRKYISIFGKKSKLVVVISSFYTDINFVQKKNNKMKFLDFLRLKLNDKDVVCGNISILDKEQTEAVVTIIRNNAQECHILKILELLQQYNLDLRHIYCFEQLPLLFGLATEVNFGKNYVPELNIVIILLSDRFFISVANGKNFLLGREIVFEANSNIIVFIANTLLMVIKNIEITYVNIHSQLKIKIFGFTNEFDVDGLKSTDAVLENIEIVYSQLPLGNVGADVLQSDLRYQLLLMIKIALPKLQYLQPLTSKIIKKHTTMFGIISYVKLIFYLFCIVTCCLFVYYIISVSTLEVERQLQKGNLAKEKQELKKYTERIKEITESVTDIAVMKMQQLKLADNYDEPLKIIAKITNDNKSILDVQGYQFDCLNSTKQDKVFFISFDIEMFNRGGSYTYTQTAINTLLTDISEELKKKYKKVSVFDERVFKLGIKDLAVKDFFDTIYVVCTNDVSYKLPTDDKQFKDFLATAKKSS